MEYIIVGILIVILILVVISLFKNIDESNITERLGKLETSIIKEVGEFKSDLNRNLFQDFESLNNKIEERLRLINDKVNERLDQNFEKSNKTFTSIVERLTKIDEAQKKIDALSTDIVSLQAILTDKKSRGIFGETSLKNILVNIFGENNTRIYELQYKFDNNTIADAIIKAPEPLGLVAIDSKFPLENYLNMVDKNLSKIERESYEKKFKLDLKKHIDDISSKYIIPNVTSNQAFMFLPAEALFAELNAYHQDIINYAYTKKVWITSPTTLMSVLTVVQSVIKNSERDKYALVIQKELEGLSLEFGRYRERWDSLSKSIDKVSKDVKEVSVTTEKISNKFESINRVEVDKFIEMKEKDD